MDCNVGSNVEGATSRGVCGVFGLNYSEICGKQLKAVANEDTMLRTHCCGHNCFPVCPCAQHLLRTQNLCPRHKKCF